MHIGIDIAATGAPAFFPKEPLSLEEAGLQYSMILDLVLKHAFFEGTATLERLAQRLKVNHLLVHALYRHFVKEQLCDTRRMIGSDYEIALTAKGRAMAEVALGRNQY